MRYEEDKQRINDTSIVLFSSNVLPWATACCFHFHKNVQNHNNTFSALSAVIAGAVCAPSSVP